MDEIDRAQHQEAISRDAALEQQRALRRRTAPLIIDGVSICLGCNQPIEPRRLQVVPDADRCTTCQEALEAYEWHGR